jgi:hypothetical protein
MDNFSSVGSPDHHDSNPPIPVPQNKGGLSHRTLSFKDLNDMPKSS